MRRARKPAGDKIDAFIGSRVERFEIGFVNGPSRTVQPQRVAGAGVDLDQPSVLEPRPLQSQSLPARAGAKFQR